MTSKHAGIAGDHIFIKLPEFSGEVADAIAAGRAVGFERYDALGAN